MAIKEGDTVKVHYTGVKKDGTQFDSSKGREPLEFTVGKHQLIPGFEKAVLGKNSGDVIKVTIPPEEGYGQVDRDLIFTVPRAQVPDNIPLKVGTPLELTSDQGGQMNVRITEVGPEEVTLDANPELAGEDLIFEIEIVDVKSAE